MNVRRSMSHPFNPTLRWRWDAAGLSGYAMTKRGAYSAARRAIAEARRSYPTAPSITMTLTADVTDVAEKIERVCDDLDWLIEHAPSALIQADSIDDLPRSLHAARLDEEGTGR